MGRTSASPKELSQKKVGRRRSIEAVSGVADVAAEAVIEKIATNGTIEIDETIGTSEMTETDGTENAEMAIDETGIGTGTEIGVMIVETGKTKGKRTMAKRRNAGYGAGVAKKNEAGAMTGVEMTGVEMTGVEMTGVERSAGAEVGTETMRKGSLGPPTFLMRNQLLPQKSLTQQPTLLNRRLGTPSPVGKPQAMSTRGLQPLPLPCLLQSNTRGLPLQLPHPLVSTTRGLQLLFPLLLLLPWNSRGLQLPLPLPPPRGLQILLPHPPPRGLGLQLPLPKLSNTHGLPLQLLFPTPSNTRGPPHRLLFPKPSSTRGLQLPLPLLAPRGLLFPKPSNTRGLPLLLPLHHWKHHHGMSTQWRWQRRRQSRP